jgi:hypothetical protein
MLVKLSAQMHFCQKTIIVVIEHLRIALVPQQTKLLTKSSGGMHGNDKRLNPPQGSTQTSQAGSETFTFPLLPERLFEQTRPLFA